MGLRIREFPIDTQCDPEIIDRIVADEMKRPHSFHLSTPEKCAHRTLTIKTLVPFIIGGYAEPTEQHGLIYLLDDAKREV